MEKFESLELSVETLRELTDEQLSQVAGGAASGKLCNTTDLIPSTDWQTCSLKCYSVTC